MLTKIPWWHHQVILSKCKNEIEAIFYIQQTIENNWSRNVLQIKIESKLFKRQGKALNNFELTLPTPQSDLARETLKDPYNDLLKTEADQPSIGIILCKSKDALEVEYALRDIKKPLGISEFTFNELPENIKGNMPTVSELENELKKLIE